MAFPDTPFTRLLGVRYPIVVAPMAGGTSTPELPVAGSEADALGSLARGCLGLADTPPDAMREAIAAVRAGTEKPFNVNLFAFEAPLPGDLAAASRLLDGLRSELGLPPPEPPTRPPFTLEDSYEVVRE